MKNILLGNTELNVSQISFGGNVFGWTLNEAESFRLLDELFEQGITFIDTANNYSHWVAGNQGGESEAILGKWFKQSKKRHDIILSTKVGGKMGDDSKGLSKENITKAVDDSLRRLQTDYIDLYFSHHDDETVPQEETMQTFHQLVKQGKVRHLGASNLSAERIVAANNIATTHNWTPYQVLQPLYNLYDRQRFEEEYLPLIQRENLGTMTYFALASGFLSGKYADINAIENSARKDMVKQYFDSRGMQILQTLKEVAQQYQTSMTSIAIAWQFYQEGVSTPIVSTTSEAQLKELLQATTLQLSPETIQQLNTASQY